MSQFEDGWIRVSRALLSPTHDLHPQSTDEPACRMAAWIDMIGMARWRPGAGLKRGQFRGSVRFLAARWNWSNGRAHRFVQHLVAEGRIRLDGQAGRKPSVITICNYDRYQIQPGGHEYATEGAERERVHENTSGAETYQESPNASGTRMDTRMDTRTGTKKKEEGRRRTKKRWMSHFNKVRKQKLPNSRGLTLTRQYGRKMDARMAEGLTEEEGLRAIDGAFASDHHRDSRWKYVTPELIFRSQGHVARFTAEAPRRNGSSGVSLTAHYECVSCLKTFLATRTAEEMERGWEKLCPECSDKPTVEVDTSALIENLTGRH